MMCSNSYLNHYIKVGQLPKCVISSSEMAGQPLAKRAVSSAKICNHVDSDKTNNQAENIEFVSTEMHSLIDGFPKHRTSQEKQMKFLKRFGEQASKEVKNQITVLLSGEQYDKEGKFIEDTLEHLVYSTDKLWFTKESWEYVNTFVIKAMSKQLVDMVVSQILLECGVEYFERPRFFTVGEEHYYKCVRTEGYEILMTDVTKEDITKDLKLIHCFVDSDGYANGFVEE